MRCLIAARHLPGGDDDRLDPHGPGPALPDRGPPAGRAGGGESLGPAPARGGERRGPRLDPDPGAQRGRQHRRHRAGGARQRRGSGGGDRRRRPFHRRDRRDRARRRRPAPASRLGAAPARGMDGQEPRLQSHGRDRPRRPPAVHRRRCAARGRGGRRPRGASPPHRRGSRQRRAPAADRHGRRDADGADDRLPAPRLPARAADAPPVGPVARRGLRSVDPDRAGCLRGHRRPRRDPHLPARRGPATPAAPGRGLPDGSRGRRRAGHLPDVRGLRPGLGRLLQERPRGHGHAPLFRSGPSSLAAARFFRRSSSWPGCSGCCRPPPWPRPRWPSACPWRPGRPSPWRSGRRGRRSRSIRRRSRWPWRSSGTCFCAGSGPARRPGRAAAIR